MTDPAARRFRPTFWASITTVVALAILLGLGSWQLQRLSWKEQLIADVSEKTAGPPVALPAELSDPAIEFTLVQVEGRFQHEKELQLASRTYEGRVGSHVITPFVLRDGRGLMIDRGWVPPEQLDPETRADNRPVGQQRLEGYLRLGGWRGMAAFRPENQPGIGLYIWPDLASMTATAGLLQPVEEVYLVLVPQPGAGRYPLSQAPPTDLPNNHLMYAYTWFALALVLLVIYVLYHLRPGDEA
jgi:surfeit locus 1 family protein